VSVCYMASASASAEPHSIDINTPGGQNVEFLNVKTWWYIYHWVLALISVGSALDHYSHAPQKDVSVNDGRHI